MSPLAITSGASLTVERGPGEEYAGPPDKMVIDKVLVSLNKLKLKGKYYERGHGGGKFTAQAPHQDHTKIYLRGPPAAFSFFEGQQLTRSDKGTHTDILESPILASFSICQLVKSTSDSSRKHLP